jgi:hypothetical protein
MDFVSSILISLQLFKKNDYEFFNSPYLGFKGGRTQRKILSIKCKNTCFLCQFPIFEIENFLEHAKNAKIHKVLD